MTYKEVFFPKIQLRNQTDSGLLKLKLPITNDGNITSTFFGFRLENIPAIGEDNVELEFTLKFRPPSAPPDEVVTFKKVSGTWVFDNSPTWMNLSSPVVTGTSLKKMIFAGSFDVTNAHQKILVKVKTTDSSSIVIVNRDFEIPVDFSLPMPSTGIGVVRKIVAHTFTDFDLLPNQATINEKFGPLSSTEFRTWAGFPTTTNALKAYAITDGEFFVQEIPSTSLLNIIIKPDKQPVTNGFPIKYIVYRGVKKTSFLDSSNEVLPSTTSGLSDLLTRMWQVRNNLNTASGVTETIKRSDIGLNELSDTPFPDTKPIEELFTNYAFQRLVPGWSIGEFDSSGQYGIQIILDSPFYRPTLGDLRILDHKITITYATGQPQYSNSQEEDIKTKLEREAILGFIDPAAYFSLLAKSKIELHKSSGNQTLDSSSDVYNEIISKFAQTKEKIYVDLRNELNNSFNFYGSYSDSSVPTMVSTLKFRDNTNNYISKEYTTDGWPVLILNATDFVSNTTDEIIKLDIQVPEGDNSLPSLFLQYASMFSDALNYGEKFIIPQLNSGYSSGIELSLLNNPGIGKPFPMYVKLNVNRRYDVENLQPIPSSLKRPWKDDYFENLMSKNEAFIPLLDNDPNNDDVVEWRSTTELKYNGWTSLKGGDFLFRTVNVKDSIGEVLFAYIDGFYEKVNLTSDTASTSNQETHAPLDIENINSFAKSFYLELRNNYKLANLSVLPLAISPSVKILKVETTNPIPVDILGKTVDDIISIAYTDAEKLVIDSTASVFLANAPYYMISFNHSLKNLGSTPYFEFELGVQGTEYNPSTFSYEVKRVNTGIKFYSWDGKNYLTNDYVVALEPLII